MHLSLSWEQLILPESKITLKNILLNPSRIAFIKVLKRMGGKIKVKNKKICGKMLAI